MEGGTSRRVTYPRATSGVIGRPTGLQLGTSGGPTNDQSVTWGYDTYGRFNSFVGGGTTLAYTYTSNSNLLASIADATSGWTQTRTYLDKRDLLDAIETKISTTTKAKFDYDPAGDGSGYDVLGRRTKVAKTGDSTTGMFIRYGNGSEGLTTYYGYDDRSQLTIAATIAKRMPSMPTLPKMTHRRASRRRGHGAACDLPSERGNETSHPSIRCPSAT